MENVNDQLKTILRTNGKVQVYLINSALDQYVADRDKVAFLSALREVIEVHGGISKAAEQTNINRQHIYKMLSSKGNPSFNNIRSLLATIGLRFKVEPYKF